MKGKNQERRRRLTPEARRALIDEAATAVFARRGYEAATLQEIAGAAGVVASVIYNHYPSKEALYLELLERHSRVLREQTTGVTRNLDPREGLRSRIDDFFSTLENDTFLWRTMFRDPPLAPEISAAHARLQVKASEAMTAVLENGSLDRSEGKGMADPQTPVMVAETVKAGLNGLASWWWDHREVERGAVVDTATSLLWEGLSALVTARSTSSSRRGHRRTPDS